MEERHSGTLTGMVKILVSLALVLGFTSARIGLGSSAQAQTVRGFNTAGNIVIADQFNNRIVEVDPATHAIVWHFGNGSPTPGPHSVVGPNDAERVNFGLTLIAGTGIPAGSTEGGCLNPAGCPDNRVFLVNQAGQIVWKYDQLNTPVFAVMLPNTDILITDQANNRVIEVTLLSKRIVWSYAMGLNNPNSAELLPNNHILIADENNNRVIEVNRAGQIVWQYAPNDLSKLNGAAFASRLPNGHTLITDSNNNRVIEIDSSGNVTWEYDLYIADPKNPPLPTRAVRLRNGDTLISEQFNDRVTQVNQAKKIVFTQGQLLKDGTGFNELNAPYDAKVVGDYTGLTPPPFFMSLGG